MFIPPRLLFVKKKSLLSLYLVVIAASLLRTTLSVEIWHIPGCC